MKELHALVDYENVQPTLEELAKLAPGFTDIWLFHGPHQAKQATQFAGAHDRVTLVPRGCKGGGLRGGLASVFTVKCSRVSALAMAIKLS